MRFLSVLLVLAAASFASGQEKPKATPPQSVLPTDEKGRPLNLDFETGDLRDWVLEGEAFKKQPIKGDTVFPRRNDNKSQHQGDYWIGGYERLGDKPQGTMASVPFKVTHPWASFLVGGGPHTVTSVEIVRKDTSQVIHRASGFEEENLLRDVVDLSKHQGKEIFIRLVDRHSGHWGHINFDDFRFHAEKPMFPARPKANPPAEPDVLKFAGLPPLKAAQAMSVPEGFDVTLFAGEPDITQPIAFCLDDRGRLWVVESNVYPQRRKSPGFLLDPKDGPGDRILIFEDADGDGKFDKRTVFMEGLNLVSGIEVGFGGVWIGAAPYLLFVPADDKDQPGEAKVLLDGWGWQDTHETLNAFIWGPDGWLYGCHGVFTHSKVGKPGTPDKERTPINAGVWRYHPTQHVFEVFAHGTSNPWGLDFNDHGEAFVEACVIPHCFHIIQGGRYNRQAGPHFNPHTYADIQTIADHRHYVGGNPHGGNNRSDSAGGGHAHCGLMCYLGGTWPEKYRGQLFMGNIHGRRLNVDALVEKGSGYVAQHTPDFLLANDAWARFINMRYGPDGNVYLIDWYDKQACHHGDPKIWDRSNGRIYKISWRGGPKWAPVDLQKKTDAELARLMVHKNDWHVRHARRILMERAHKNPKAWAAGEQKDHPINLLWEAAKHDDPARRLRGLWALHSVSALSVSRYWEFYKDSDAHVRGWAIQLGLEEELRVVKSGVISADSFVWLVKLARNDPSPVVRRYLASASPRLPEGARWGILQELLAHGADDADHNLPLLYWYAAEPLAAENPEGAINLAAKGKIPLVLEFMIRRIGSDGSPESLRALTAAMKRQADDEARLLVFLRGLAKALEGRRNVAPPDAWADLEPRLRQSKDPQVAALTKQVGLIFGDAQVLAATRNLLQADITPAKERLAALQNLLAARDPQLPPVLLKLLKEPELRGPALRGLAQYEVAEAPGLILEHYPQWTAADKRDALNTLASRLSYARALLEGVRGKKVPAADVSADIVRQLRNLGGKELDKNIADVWGVVRDTAADKAQTIAKLKTMIAKGPAGDLALGRAQFAKHCAQCHTLFGAGNKVGPDITGANRASLDYLLENIVDPSALIPKEYAATFFELENGRFITGLVRGETPAAYQVATANEELILPKKDVLTRKPLDKSMMPDDVVGQLKDHELRGLIAYLQSPTQTPLLATQENAKDFFNGKNLTGWEGSKKYWSVDKGEIIGKSPGIEHNTFLISDMWVNDFRLALKVKLTPNKENSGIQFRSEILARPASVNIGVEEWDVKGYQADIGAGWWGKLYEEHGRGLLWKEPGEGHVKKDDWNEYKIEATGSRIRTWLNGKLCVDLDDPKGARRGIIALQLHSGGALEVRFREVRLEVLDR